MFCPRCGAESEDGSRYCASCGNELPRKAEPAAPAAAGSGGIRAGFERLVGTSRRSRMLTAATAAAIAVAVVAFIALAPADEDVARVPQDGLTKALDASCVRHKAAIANAQEQALGSSSVAGVSGYGESIVPIVGEWRLELARAEVPPGRVELVGALSIALLEVEIEAGTLGRAAREGRRQEVAAVAARVDAATANVEAAIQGLELQRCEHLEIAQGRLIRE